jgi:hypothetical protein
MVDDVAVAADAWTSKLGPLAPLPLLGLRRRLFCSPSAAPVILRDNGLIDVSRGLRVSCRNYRLSQGAERQVRSSMTA